MEQSTQEMDVNLNSVLTTELKFLEADIFFKHEVEKLIQLCESLPSIRGIYSDFSQSLSNIMRNALDAMRTADRKRLTVRTYLAENHTCVETSYTGEGIPEENVKHLFKPHFSTKRHIGEGDQARSSGTGLGLYMVYELLRKYNAEYDIRSTVGKGPLS